MQALMREQITASCKQLQISQSSSTAGFKALLDEFQSISQAAWNFLLPSFTIPLTRAIRHFVRAVQNLVNKSIGIFL